MKNGVKQGCPMSPILYNLAIDPLLTKLASTPDLDVKAYCDDVGSGFDDWEVVPTILTHISDYNLASGSSSNVLKTFFVPG